MNRNVSLDILKVILSFMVIGLHSGFLLSTTLIGSYLTVNGLFRIAVPLFLLISGFYFYTVIINKRTAVWFKRVLLLYLFWMIVYSAFWYKHDYSLLGFAQLVVVGYYHLWYLPGMLGAAILVFLFKRMGLRVNVIFILVAFLVGVIIQYAGNYHLFINAELDRWFNVNWVHRNFLFFAFPFFCGGFLIHKYKLHERISFRHSLVLSCIGIFLLLGESYVNYISPQRDGGFDNFLSLLFVAPAVFITFLNIHCSGKSKDLALYSTGIYFVHILFLKYLNSYFDFTGSTLTILTILLSIFASFFLIKLNKHLKIAQ